MTTQRDSILESLESIAPKFPPQDVNIPNIGTTNGLNMPQMCSLLDSSGFPGNSSGSPRSHPNFPNLTFSSSTTTVQQSSTIRMSPMSSSILNASPSPESSEDSDDSVPLAQLVQRQADDLAPVKTSPKTAAAKKPRIPKKKKKRDPNEPPKPVSAYALFFRDTQAAIKGQNPNATFGEVSKIVASMWEGLDTEHKTIYKKKTDIAKKEYLKQLAAYRASLVLQQLPMEDSPSPTGTSPPHMNPLGPQHMGSPLHSQSLQHISSPRYEPSPTHHTAQPTSSPWQVSSPQRMVGSQHVYSNAQSPPQYDNNGLSVSQYDMGFEGYGQHVDALDDDGLHMDSQTLPPTGVNTGNVYQAGMCIRSGCHNRAIDNTGWDNEYCSNECVVSHCRDVFAAWVANRQVPVNTYTVK